MTSIGKSDTGMEDDDMSMINCPACKKEISDMAETCPHCGHPIRKATLNHYPTGVRVAVIIGAILGGLVMIVAIANAIYNLSYTW